MTDLIERMARAIASVVAERADNQCGDREQRVASWVNEWWQSYLPHARAAWAVAAEPTDAMFANSPQSRGPSKTTWQAMHGAADD